MPRNTALKTGTAYHYTHDKKGINLDLNIQYRPKEERFQISIPKEAQNYAQAAFVYGDSVKEVREKMTELLDSLYSQESSSETFIYYKQIFATPRGNNASYTIGHSGKLTEIASLLYGLDYVVIEVITIGNAKTYAQRQMDTSIENPQARIIRSLPGGYTEENKVPYTPEAKEWFNRMIDTVSSAFKMFFEKFPKTPKGVTDAIESIKNK